MNYCKVAGAAVFALFAAVPVWAQTVTVLPSKPGGVYAAGEKIVWNIGVAEDATGVVQSVHYRLKRGGGRVVAEGDTVLTGGAGRIETSPGEPMAYLMEVSTTGADGKAIRVFGGAAVEPTKIKPSAPRPKDFDAFWKAKLAELAAVPMNPVVTAGDSGREGVEYGQVKLGNIGGATVHTQLARPKTGTKFPAIIVLQWAGVYGLPKQNVTGYAAKGWLALNVMAHDLPLDESPEFYKKQNETTLRDYINIGNRSRDTSYFLRMILGCYRASEYLMSRPDWDGRILVASGTSQGGLQSIALTGLQPKVTAMTVNVPAGCDHAGVPDGRGVSWPYYAVTGSDKAVLQTSSYFDAIHFASRIRVPSLIGVGLLDQTSAPSGVFAMANQIPVAKEMVILPLSDHQGQGGFQTPYYQRADAWLSDLQKGKSVPIRSGL
ncbi:MAG: acetylxylan esterase [Akkermansiaceae bacterium]|nr:acetylxylan esterase [Armatimonadota bacterium]